MSWRDSRAHELRDWRLAIEAELNQGRRRLADRDRDHGTTVNTKSRAAPAGQPVRPRGELRTVEQERDLHERRGKQIAKLSKVVDDVLAAWKTYAHELAMHYPDVVHAPERDPSTMVDAGDTQSAKSKL